MARAGHPADVTAPFYGAILNAYARGDVSDFGEEVVLEEVPAMDGESEPVLPMGSYESLVTEMTPTQEWRLPIPNAVRELIMHTFTTDVAAYLTMLRAKEAIWKVVKDSWEEFGAEGPDLVVAHSLGTVVIWDLIVRFGMDLPAPNGLLMMGSPLYLGDVIRGIAGEPDTDLGIDPWIHIYDDGDIVAGGRRLAPAFTRVQDVQVENKSFPSSHSYPAYVQAAAVEGLYDRLLA
jgi:hypothetical protein